MANTKFQIKRTSVPDKVPLSSDLEVGELAINLADRLLYSKDTSNTIFSITATGSGVGAAYADYGLIITSPSSNLNYGSI